jgi:uncharacterized membrane protein
MNLGPISIDPIFPWWVLLGLVSGALLAAFYYHRSVRRRIVPRKALAVSSLRLGAFFILLLLALNPSLRATKEVPVKPSLAILLDTSESMASVEPEKKTSRLEQAKARLFEGDPSLFTSLTENFLIRFYALNENFKEMGLDDLRGSKAQGKGGDLSDALRRLAGKNDIGLLFSDGNLQWTQAKAPRLPLFILPAGNAGEYKDLLIQEVKAPALAFRGKEVSIDVTLKGYGYKGSTLPVLLKEGRRVRKAKTVAIREDPFTTTLSFSYLPQEIGRHHLAVSIPVQVDERLRANNTRTFSLQVVRDKIRILMISGSPSVNYRFMRIALKNDPTLDLLSFVILRTPSDILNVPLQEQSLIPFPVETLFLKELKNFDILAFDNFPYHLFLNPAYLEKIKDFVKEGGGLALIGGPQLLDGGRYRGTALEDLLPLRLQEKEIYRRDTPRRISLTRIGRKHPITRLSADEKDNLTLWQEMPPLDGINILEARSSASVLLESGGGYQNPILIINRFAKGRVLILATDYAWKWYMGMVAEGKGNWAYLRLMERMVRWLVQDPGLEPIQIIQPEKAAEVGEERELRIKVRTEESHPGQKGTVSLSIYRPDGRKILSPIKPAGPAGEYVASFRPETEGVYRIKVATLEGQREETMAISGPPRILDAAPDHAKLRKIAEATGGKILSGGDEMRTVLREFSTKEQSRILEESRLPLMGKSYLLAFLVALLATEWYLRRRWGLI